MACLTTCDLGNRTVKPNLNLLIDKDLRNGKAWKTVWAGTRRVAPDAPFRLALWDRLSSIRLRHSALNPANSSPTGRKVGAPPKLLHTLPTTSPSRLPPNSTSTFA